MAQTLTGMHVAILVGDGFEQVEMTEPRKALDAAGATTVLVSPCAPEVQGFNHDDRGERFPVDCSLDQANATDFDALLIPGGVRSPDRLRMEPTAVSFVKQFTEQGKPVAAICHGPWMLVEAGAVKGGKLTSWPSLQTDIRNAGGTWVDEVVVEDNNIVTSRKPDDIPTFSQTMIDLFARKRETTQTRIETGTIAAPQQTAPRT